MRPHSLQEYDHSCVSHAYIDLNYNQVALGVGVDVGFEVGVGVVSGPVL